MDEFSLHFLLLTIDEHCDEPLPYVLMVKDKIAKGESLGADTIDALQKIENQLLSETLDIS